jgi:predicted MFS family arabinose efflux permease
MADQEYQGRVMSLTMLSFSFSGLAALPIGMVADAVGLRETFVLMGLTMGTLVIVINVIGGITGIRSRVPEPALQPEAATEPASRPAVAGSRRIP